MTDAELLVSMTSLGFSQRTMIELLQVSERSIRRWLRGEYPVPDGVAKQIAEWNDRTNALVEELLGTEELPMYHSTRELWKAQPHTKPFPLSWWIAVCARVYDLDPAVRITY